MIVSKLALIGPGLLGGSIALAVREHQPKTRIAIWARREAAVMEVQEAGIADLASTDLKAVVTDADLIILCVPVETMSGLSKAIVPWIRPDAVLTDVGSVKAPVVEALREIYRNRGRFVGSHPMAGSEQAGLSAARADLFQGAVCILTPEAETDPAAVQSVEGFWAALGCSIRMLSPSDHDEVIALVSHLPHLMAATLVNLVAEQNSAALGFCGNGFRDTTRVASGSPELWTGIFAGNLPALRKSVHAMIEKLREVERLLDHPNQMNEFLTQAKRHRDPLARRN